MTYIWQLSCTPGSDMHTLFSKWKKIEYHVFNHNEQKHHYIINFNNTTKLMIYTVTITSYEYLSTLYTNLIIYLNDANIQSEYIE